MFSLQKAVFSIIIICFVFPLTVAADELIRAQVGIEIIKDGKKDSGKKAGAMNNILSTGESLMVHVTPEKDAFVYIVNSNKNGAELLNANRKEQLAKKAETRIYPTANQSYKPDGKNEEFITIVTSSKEQTKIKSLFASGPVSYDKWTEVEQELLGKRPALTPNETSETIRFGGTVRGLAKTRTSSGMGWIVKRYQFNVKK